MNLKLGIVLSCAEAGCRTRLVDSNDVIMTRYSVLVQDRIPIQRGQLVAVRMRTDVPEIVWRWIHARVDSFEGDRVIVEAAHQPCELVALACVEELDLPLKIGDEVWACSTGQAFEVHDLIRKGKPAHPDRLLTYIRPIIAAIYNATSR